MPSVFKPSWTTGVALKTAATLNAGGSLQDDVNLASDGYFEAEFFVSVTTIAAGDITIEVFGSSDVGTSISTEPLQKFIIPFTAAATKSRSFVISGPWRRVKVSNGGASNATLTTKLAGKQMQSV